MANGNPSIFGISPQQVLAQQELERLRNAQIFSQLGPAGFGAISGQLIAQGLFGGSADPRLRQAREMQKIQQEITQMGLEPGDPRFTKEVVSRVQARIGLDAAFQARQLAVQAEKEKLDLDLARGEILGSELGRESRLKAIRAMFKNAPQEVQNFLADNPDVANKAIQERLKPKDLSNRVQDALFATGGNQEQARALVQRSLVKPISEVTISQGEKPLGKDANLYTLPNGEDPPPGMTFTQLVAAGGRQKTLGEKSAETTTATIRARIKVFDDELRDAKSAFQKANSAWTSSPNMSTQLEARNAAANLRLKLGQRANVMGEPSDTVARAFGIPSTLMTAMAKILGFTSPAEAFGEAPQPSAGNLGDLSDEQIIETLREITKRLEGL